MARVFILIALLSLFIGGLNCAFAQESPQDGAGLCHELFETLEQGVATRDAVSSYILVGHSPCFVIQCAVEGKANIEDIVEGALYAGVTTDVITRCALLGGAAPEGVAEAIENLVPPEGPTPGPYSGSPLEKPHVPVSPSGF